MKYDPEKRAAVQERAKKILGELREKYPGADSLGAGEIAAVIRKRTSRKKASAASIANALRGGIFHDGRAERGEIGNNHQRRRIWNVPIEAVAINVAEIIEGSETDVSIADILRGWYVVRIEPMEPIGAISRERVVLDYRPSAPADPERLDAAMVDAFLDAVGAEIERLDAVAMAAKDRRALRRVSHRE